MGLGCVLLAAGCGTDAVGTSECRAFERVRCRAAVACGYPDVEECERYQRDQCLHGVALESVTVNELDACAEDVARAGRCAGARGAATAAGSCNEPVLASPASSTACDVVRSPELAVSCAFLVPNGEAAAPAPRPAAADGGA